jgi:prepilin signal peptidase PulO-like enzyme (type II secretory pathway)
MSLAPLLVIGWCFVVGACVGSFLNVVAWRLPSGMSLSWPGSHCPSCKKPILFRDNVPVLGWLWLRGRCRSCVQPISPRYPLVEFVTGAAFAALAYPELFGGGMNLPWAQFRPRDLLVFSWLYHAVLMAVLIVLALFDFDGVPAPRRSLAAGIAAGLIPPLVWPELYPVPIGGLPPPVLSGDGTLGGFEQLATGLAGLACGAAFGALLEWAHTGGRFGPMRGGLALALGLCGAFLGWQAAMSTACLLTIAILAIDLLVATLKRRLSSVAFLVPAAALVQICAWAQLSDLDWWPGPYAAGARMALAGATMVAASTILAVLGRLRSEA